MNAIKTNPRNVMFDMDTSVAGEEDPGASVDSLAPIVTVADEERAIRNVGPVAEESTDESSQLSPEHDTDIAKAGRRIHTSDQQSCRDIERGLFGSDKRSIAGPAANQGTHGPPDPCDDSAVDSASPSSTSPGHAPTPKP
jgi:hypothetical protein